MSEEFADVIAELGGDWDRQRYVVLELGFKRSGPVLWYRLGFKVQGSLTGHCSKDLLHLCLCFGVEHR